MEENGLNECIENNRKIWVEKPQIQRKDFLFVLGFFLIWISNFFWGNPLFLSPFYIALLTMGFVCIGYLALISIISILERFNVYYYLTPELFGVVNIKKVHHRYKKSHSERNLKHQSEMRIILDNIKRITIKNKIYGIQFRFEYIPDEDSEDGGDFETVGIKKYTELISSLLISTNLKLIIEKKKVLLI
jgi:hypothetical protein